MLPFCAVHLAHDGAIHQQGDHRGQGDTRHDRNARRQARLHAQRGDHRRRHRGGAMGQVEHATQPVQQAQADAQKAQLQAVDDAVHDDRLHQAMPR